jgi:hypothetical protein
MAYPGDLSNPARKSPGAVKSARLTPEDFEQLAAAFRPSWELDEAPFTGAGTMASADLRALQGAGGTRADVRVAAHGSLSQPPAASAPPTPMHVAPTPSQVAPPQVAPAPVAPPPVQVAPAQVAPPVPMAAVQTAPPPVQVAPIPSAPPPVAPHGGNGSRPAPAATAWAPDAGPKVVVERAITAADIAAAGPPPPPMAPTPLGPPVVELKPSADRLAQTRIVHRSPALPVPRESTGSFDLARASFATSKRPLWIGLGVGVVAIAAAGIWVSMGNSDAKAVPAPPVLVKTAEAPVPEIPPPPPETTPTVVAPPPKTVSVASLPTAATPPAPPSVPPPVVQRVAPPPAPPPAARPVYVAPAPPRPPVARPKAGGTIVHDVPF